MATTRSNWSTLSVVGSGFTLPLEQLASLPVDRGELASSLRDRHLQLVIVVDQLDPEGCSLRRPV